MTYYPEFPSERTASEVLARSKAEGQEGRQAHEFDLEEQESVFRSLNVGLRSLEPAADVRMDFDTNTRGCRLGL